MKLRGSGLTSYSFLFPILTLVVNISPLPPSSYLVFGEDHEDLTPVLLCCLFICTAYIYYSGVDCCPGPSLVLPVRVLEPGSGVPGLGLSLLLLFGGGYGDRIPMFMLHRYSGERGCLYIAFGAGCWLYWGVWTFSSGFNTWRRQPRIVRCIFCCSIRIVGLLTRVAVAI